MRLLNTLFPIEAIHQRVPLGFNLDKVPSGHVNPADGKTRNCGIPSGLALLRN